jgi:hypothetical protein
VGSGTRDLDTRLRRRRVYAKFDDMTVTVFELATMCSLGKNRGHWPDGLLISLTLIDQLRQQTQNLEWSPSVGDLAKMYLRQMLEECQRRDAKTRETAQ